MSNITIRMATLEDAEEILNIYEPYILNTTISFEYDKVPLPKFKERMEKIMLQFPWLVIHVAGKMAGYAYCSPHLERAAFAWDCECTVYIASEYQHRGIASTLYQILFELVKQQGYYNIYALICDSNRSSINLHKKHGFREVGTYYKTAYKLGEWRNLMVLEKQLRGYSDKPEKIKTIHELSQSEIVTVIDRVIFTNKKQK